tara:strand:- start:4117 stop:4557 length:441 start_codon:yes stop_codon:yes gene_type:complete
MKKQSPYLESWLLSLAILVFFNTEVAASKEVNIEKILSKMEIADNYSKRKTGLMYRDNIEKDFGMLFIWDTEEIQCMWMKNTSIPLSIAFIKEEGEISDIYDLYPFSTVSVCSTDKVKYALEVNRGWFAEKEISLGDTLTSSKIKW